ncbi:ribosome-associated translation inhibitor RaiA [Candidatus Acetothermia bacterium]|nr:MAG: ribosome-associated translation inhibitor RaiA [Candidatus Acetothermia bacterium]
MIFSGKGGGMKVKIVERHTGSSEALRSYVIEKTSGLERYFDGIVSIDVVLTVEKERQIADMHAHLVNRKVITAREESSDMYASIDAAIDKLKRQLVKYKDQLTSVKDRGKKEALPEEAVGKVNHREIIRTDTYFQKPMTPEEAALQLDAIDKGFLVFINAETDAVNIIYHRRDGNYGLIEPRR